MSASIYTNAKVLANEFDLTAYFKTVKPTRGADALDKTTLASGRFKEFMPGLKFGSLSAEGLFDRAPGALDEVLEAALGAEVSRVVTVIDDNTVGGDAILLKADETKYEVGLKPAEIIQSNAEFVANEGIESGVVLEPASTKTATGNGSGVDNGAATAGGVGHLHVVSVAGEDAEATVKIQHSADASVWVDLITFAAATAAGHERVEVTGTVNRYLRAIRTIAGTTPEIDYAVAFARRY